MGYVIAALLVVLIVAAAIGLFVRGATTRRGQAPFAAPGEGTPVGEGRADGESESSRPVQPASERLADRPR
jgi:hypothetical protein